MLDLVDRRTGVWAVVLAVAGLAFFLFLEWREDPAIAMGELALESLELIPVIGATVGVMLLFRSVARQREEQLVLLRDLEVARVQGQRWRKEARSLLDGLGEAIEAQFTRWGLTDAEREVALLLLKGLSLKEISSVRVTTERTIRAQAQSVYAKANVTGRAALSAFFLEDLLAPIGTSKGEQGHT